MTPAQYVRAARRALGLSVAELADRLNISPRTIEDWEQGRSEPKGAAQRLLEIILLANNVRLDPEAESE